MDSLASSSLPNRAAMANPRSGEVLLSTEEESEKEEGTRSARLDLRSLSTDRFFDPEDLPESCIRDTTSKTKGS